MKKLFIGNIPYSWNSEDVEFHLDKLIGFGAKNISAKVVVDEKNRNRGFAFVDTTDEAANKLIEHNGVFINERKLRIQIADDTKGGRYTKAQDTATTRTLSCANDTGRENEGVLGREPFHRVYDFAGTWPGECSNTGKRSDVL